MINLFKVDCMEYMRDCGDNAFDLAIVDPPYFSIAGTKIFSGSEISTTGIRRNRFDSKEWEVPNETWLAELMRVSKHQIIWGCNYFKFYHACGRIVWDKQNDASNFSKCELASTDLHYGVHQFRYTWNGMIQQDMKNKEIKIHPTQKPIALYKWLLQNYAKEGDRILDTHLGSGSNAIAAHYGGYDFVGCEIDKDYYDAACQRFDAATAQLAMEL